MMTDPFGIKMHQHKIAELEAKLKAQEEVIFCAAMQSNLYADLTQLFANTAMEPGATLRYKSACIDTNRAIEKLRLSTTRIPSI